MKEKRQIDESILLRRFITAVTIPGLIFSLAACHSVAPTGAAGAAPPAASATVELTIKIKAAPGAPDNYDLVPGDAAAGVAVEVGGSGSANGPAYTATTDESGHAVLMVQSGSYRVSANKATNDPKCWWNGSTEVEISDQPVTAKVDDLWVQCE